jgi:hypothetical protein
MQALIETDQAGGKWDVKEVNGLVSALSGLLSFGFAASYCSEL